MTPLPFLFFLCCLYLIKRFQLNFTNDTQIQCPKVRILVQGYCCFCFFLLILWELKILPCFYLGLFQPKMLSSVEPIINSLQKNYLSGRCYKINSEHNFLSGLCWNLYWIKRVWYLYLCVFSLTTQWKNLFINEKKYTCFIIFSLESNIHILNSICNSKRGLGKETQNYN